MNASEQDMVKVTFINGAKLKNVDGLFNAELAGNKWRAIKFFEGDKVNATVAFNDAKGKGKAKPARKPR